MIKGGSRKYAIKNALSVPQATLVSNPTPIATGIDA
jgi:hypothetical protein